LGWFDSSGQGQAQRGMRLNLLEECRHFSNQGSVFTISAERSSARCGSRLGAGTSKSKKPHDGGTFSPSNEALTSPVRTPLSQKTSPIQERNRSRPENPSRPHEALTIPTREGSLLTSAVTRRIRRKVSPRKGVKKLTHNLAAGMVFGRV
jgi:hypothetical protein